MVCRRNGKGGGVGRGGRVPRAKEEEKRPLCRVVEKGGAVD